MRLFLCGIGCHDRFVKQKSHQRRHGYRSSFYRLFALGLVLVSKTRSNRSHSHFVWQRAWNFDLRYTTNNFHISSVTAILLLFRRDLLLFCFDPTHSLNRYQHWFASLSTSFCSLSRSCCGIANCRDNFGCCHVGDPGATAYLLTDRFDRMSWLAIGSSILSSVVGVCLLDG